MRFAPWLAALAGLAVVAACGSDPATPSKGHQAGSSGDVLEEVLAACTAFGEELCASAGPCCEQSGEFVADDCVAQFVEDVCTPSAQLVAAGQATYDASAEEACLTAHQHAYDVCVADWETTMTLRREYWAACRVIGGKVLEGHPCDNDARCALPPVGEEATSACIGGICKKIAILKEGEECPYPNGDVSLCDLGLYCTAEDPGTTGSCVPATPLGEACDPEFLNVECGLGSYCDLTDGLCMKTTNVGGPSCTQETECVSFQCDRVLQECRPPISTAASLCGAT